jgi:hypothetical protein
MKLNSVAASRQSAAGQKRNAAFCRKPLHLPTQLERDTLLTPLWVAESIVQEVERYLKTDLPPHWARRLAVKAHYLYPRHKHFKNGLNRPGWRGLENLRMFMRHWTAGWLNHAHSPLYKRLPYSFRMGQRLPISG